MKAKTKKKQVGTGKYDKEYFNKVLKSLDYSKKISFGSFGHVYRHMAKLNELLSSDKVVDFGCGNGELSFCLHKKYRPTVIGIDYSKDAIDIANANLEKLRKNDSKAKISFVNANNNNLPELINISGVYFSDVLEHMYDHEIDLVLEKIKNWNSTSIKVFVHTDNDFFLRFVRPFIDFVSVITKVSTMRQIRDRNLWEQERHVNLTNPIRLRMKLQSLGFDQIKMTYPEVNIEEVEGQLAGLSKLIFFKKVILFLLPWLKFLSPSFYAVYEYNSR